MSALRIITGMAVAASLAIFANPLAVPSAFADVPQDSISDDKWYVVDDAVVDDAKARLSELEDKLSDAESENAALKTRLATAESRLSAAEQSVSNAERDLSSVASKWDGIAQRGGATMTGELIVSTGGVAVGSRMASASTVPALIEELRYSSGLMGSAYLSAYSLSGITAPAGWYNYIWIPHRVGGFNGTARAGSDNSNYGTLLLFGMTIDTPPKCIRFSSSSIISMKEM